MLLRRLLFFGIGAKLGVSLGFGVLLVGAIGLGEHVSGRYVSALITTADGQRAIVAQSLLGQTRLQSIEIAARAIRGANTADQVNSSVLELQQAALRAQSTLSSLKAAASSEEDRGKIARIIELAGNYIANLEKVASDQTEILSLFNQLDATEREWTVAFNRLTNSDSFTYLPNASLIEGLITDAGSAFKDARTATWRYFVLRESYQVQRISSAADQAVEKLGFATRDLKDAKLVGSVQKLQAIVPHYVQILKRIATTISSQSNRLAAVADPSEAEMGRLLQELAADSAARSDLATNNWVAGSALAERLRVFAELMVSGLLLAVAVFASLSIARPIKKIAVTLAELSKGDADIQIPYMARTDEVGAVARSAAIFKKNLTRLAEIETSKLELSRKAEAERKTTMERIASTFEATIGEIVNSISAASMNLEQSAGLMRRATDVTKQLTTTLSSTAEEASANVVKVSRSTENITSVTADIAKQSQISSDLAQQAVQETRDTDRRMAELATAAGRIEDVVGLITEIAGKTNLLALNATIEAARAGESGRGFGVVAAEVKELSKQTAAATTQITEYVASIQSATTESATALRQIGDTIEKLAELSAVVASAVNKQETGTNNISVDLKGVATSATQVASKVAQLDKEARGAETASVDVLTSAETLRHDSDRLRADAARFLAMVRAAN